MSVRLRILAIGVALLARGAMEAQSAAPSEYQVKAAFLYNFVKFVDWPAGQQEQLAICVIGKDPFKGALERAIEGKSLDGRPFALRRIGEPGEARGCRVLFVGSSEAKRTAEIVDATRPWAVLTVSEIDGFSKRGGMIGFLMEGQRVRFQINAAAASSAGLRISSRLLQLAAPPEAGR